VIAQGRMLVAAEPARVRTALHDPAVLRAGIPGCSPLLPLPGGGYAATLEHPLGPVMLRLAGTLHLNPAKTGDEVSFHGAGKGRIAGSIQAHGALGLSPVPSGSALTYRVEVTLGGLLDRLVTALFPGFADRAATHFLTRIIARIETDHAA
jgi:uncharacterized protein